MLGVGCYKMSINKQQLLIWLNRFCNSTGQPFHEPFWRFRIKPGQVEEMVDIIKSKNLIYLYPEEYGQVLDIYYMFLYSSIRISENDFFRLINQILSLQISNADIKKLMELGLRAWGAGGIFELAKTEGLIEFLNYQTREPSLCQQRVKTDPLRVRLKTTE